MGEGIPARLGGGDRSDQCDRGRSAPTRALVVGCLVADVFLILVTGLYWAAAAGALVAAVAIRAIYVRLRNPSGGVRPVVSPWTLLLASLLAAAAMVGIGIRASQQPSADSAVALACAEQSMQSFDRTAVTDRRFSRPDFEKFSRRFCAAAVDRGLARVDVASRAPLVELRDSIIAEMLVSGELHLQAPAAAQ
jgi:hypothetical protein